jgi:hypothetical protein
MKFIKTINPKLKQVALETGSDEHELQAILENTTSLYFESYAQTEISWSDYIEEVTAFDYCLPRSVLEVYKAIKPVK